MGKETTAAGRVWLDRAWLIPARDPEAPLQTLDLTGKYNSSLDIGWRDVAWNTWNTWSSLKPLAPGIHRLGGQPFDIRGIIQLAGTGLDDPVQERFPREVMIKIGSSIRRLHPLHAVGDSLPTPAPVARLVFHYLSGESAEIPLVQGVDSGPWWVRDTVAPAPRIAWQATHPDPEWSEEWRLALYIATKENPHPDKPVKEITLASAMSHASPFFVALTTED